MSEHLTVLQVVLPLLAAPFCLLLRRGAAARILASAVALTGLLISLALWQTVRTAGVISYELGGWPPPWGIEYRVDSLNALVLVLVSAVAAVIVPIAGLVGDDTVPAHRRGALHALLLLCLTGLLGVTVTGDAFNAFVFLEIASLAAYALVALGPTRAALRAAYSYLVLGTIGGTFYLIGIGLAYHLTGTLNMADLAERLLAVQDNRAAHAAFAFVTVGAGIKIAIFPLHHWLPNAYARAPAVVSAFLSATATKVAFYLLVRMSLTVFGARLVFGSLHFGALLMPLSLLAIFIGSLAALQQTDLKRLLAYSSVAQVGYMTAGLSEANVTGLTGGIVHVVNHGLVKAGLFLVTACLVARLGSSQLTRLRGLGRRMPLTAAAFVVGGLGLIGVPGTAGFVSKWQVVLGALEAGQGAAAVLLLLGSLPAIAYVWRVVEVAYFQPAEEGALSGEAPWYLLVPAWILVGSTLVFGLWTDFTLGTAAAAARDLLRAAP